MLNNCYDIAIIGGGINGVGIARDAAGRGLKVFLCEQGDFGSGTSSKSSKLIHGGLRYLEHYEFRLVRESLLERERLLKIAPHIIHPKQFIMPYDKSFRPAWLIRLGLFLYDNLARRRILSGSSSINLRKHYSGIPLQNNLTTAFVYSDCTVDDSRLVILNAVSAKELGATVVNYTRCISANHHNGLWEIIIEGSNTKKISTVKAKLLINATGPWLNQVLENLKIPHAHHVKMIQGSHIIVPKLYEGGHAYTLQNTDKRIVFVIPYQNKFSLIGTTDIEYSGDPSKAVITEEEITYLCNAVNRYFNTTLDSKNILHTFSGVRPLQQEHVTPSTISRDYKLELLNAESMPFLNIIGGKITTYRRLAEHALEIIQPLLGNKNKPWTANVPLPGGNILDYDLNKFITKLKAQYDWLPYEICQRYAQCYGTYCYKILEHCHTLKDLGNNFGNTLCQKEIDYLINNEWIKTVDDLVWRRTKLGLELSQDELNSIHNYLINNI